MYSSIIIVYTFLLITLLNRIQFTQKNIAFVLYIATQWATILKQSRITQVQILSNEILIIAKRMIQFSSTIDMRHALASEGYVPHR